MKQDPIIPIRELIQSAGYHPACTLTPLPPSGSDRRYYRVSFEDTNQPDLMAFYQPCVEENRAQMEFTRHFKSLGFRVPAILAHNPEKTVFLVENLGKLSLFEKVSQGIDNEVINTYKQVLTDLVKFQVKGINGLDISQAYPAPDFDRQSILWDLNYFKYDFLKPAGISFNELQLERDFRHFADLLEQAKPNFFCYRDFQTRNIMIHEGQPWYIDFQGGRRGPLPYDVVSLLHQVKANLPEELKDSLFEYYLEQLKTLAPDEVEPTRTQYNPFVYFRLLQVFGAYGFRGLVERKAHFLQSLPLAAIALKRRLENHPLDIALPELEKIFPQIIDLYPVSEKDDFRGLTIEITSFSFKNKGLPPDLSGNGGGFVFDCRYLPNPHRVAQLRDLTGEDQPIVEYMLAQPQTEIFLTHVKGLVEAAVDNYLQRGFERLQINFGCTGGRHRSVFSAVQLKEYLQSHYPEVRLLLHHREIVSQR